MRSLCFSGDAWYVFLGRKTLRPRHTQSLEPRTRTCMPSRQVLLVGVLGEDRLTCVDAEILGFSIRGTPCASCTLVIATALLIILCVALLTNEAAQVMATWTFDGTDYRMGAVIGLVLCVSVPFALLAFVVYSKVTLSRLIQECPPTTDESPEAPPARAVLYRGYTAHAVVEVPLPFSAAPNLKSSLPHPKTGLNTKNHTQPDEQTHGLGL